MPAQQTLDQLNDRFSIDGQLRFVKSHGDFIIAHINNPSATAQVALYGAHVLQYQPAHHQQVLWLSQSCVFQTGKAIRGGVPLCWPWFGPHGTDAKKPAHGFARISHWTVDASGTTDEGASFLQLSLSQTPATQALWPHEFKFVATITIGKQLTVSLTTHNLSQQEITCSGAMHTYFNIADISNTSILGLEDAEYIDKLDQSQHKHQQGPIQIDAPMDRVYINTRSACTINDAGYKRKIVIEKSGSESTVVWNPWQETAKSMQDFDDEGYRHMVCVESCNAGPDVVKIIPGATHTLETRISIETVE